MDDASTNKARAWNEGWLARDNREAGGLANNPYLKGESYREAIDLLSTADTPSVSQYEPGDTIPPEPKADGEVGMDDETADSWLRKSRSHVVLDNLGNAWQLDEDGYDVVNGSDVKPQLLKVYAPYTPLAPATRTQFELERQLRAMTAERDILSHELECVLLRFAGSETGRIVRKARAALPGHEPNDGSMHVDETR